MIREDVKIVQVKLWVSDVPVQTMEWIIDVFVLERDVGYFG